MQSAPSLVDNAPPDRYCDLVMKGGVASGVVYPAAIVQLSEVYRFNRIGGTSVGAIAAALTAAAEYQRRHGSMAGFQHLAELPDLLAERVGDHTRLHSLFQPEPAMRRLFRALSAMLNRKSDRDWLIGAIKGLLLGWGGPAGIGAAIGFVIALLLSLGGGVTGKLVETLHILLGLVIGGGIGLLTGIVRDLLALPANGFGLCRGRTVDPVSPGLVPWLHALLQQMAGRSTTDAPLTFEDLWTAPGYPPPWLDAPPAPSPNVKGPASIDLQLFTTSLSQGRPWRLPDDLGAGPPGGATAGGADSGHLYYRRSELASYFPADVLEYLDDLPPGHLPAAVGPRDGDLRRLPMAKLPVIVAVRMSLSFPLLLSAVPLWAIDDSSPRRQPRLRRCWFSDGGICTNFPMHLFDSLIPKWPTFGINLGRVHPEAGDRRVWMPENETEGGKESWDLAWDDDIRPLDALRRFGRSIFASAQTWNDAASLRMPGVRDRVVHVDLDADQGGLNIDMPTGTIEEMSGYGKTAGALLRQRFIDEAKGRPTPAWNAHRWIRFNTLLTALAKRLDGTAAAIELDQHATPLPEQIRRALDRAPLPGTKPITDDQARALEQMLRALVELEQAFDKAPTAPPYQPQPQPEIKVRLPL